MNGRASRETQAPPCVAYWSGDNGSATSRGVTRDEVRVSDSSFDPARVRWIEAYGQQLLDDAYRVQLLVASGIQMAGPDSGR